MVTKKLNKLVLKKETIANLSDDSLKNVKGGDSWIPVKACTGAYSYHYQDTCRTEVIGDCITVDMEICRWSDYHC